MVLRIRVFPQGHKGMVKVGPFGRRCIYSVDYAQ